MASESVKVAVRCRPFRERARNATLIVDMKGASTYLTDPENPNEEPRDFTFDYSYWSHDGCKEEANGYYSADPKHPNGKKFADQQRVFQDLGQEILNNTWEGYNSTLFAYGQTGSGKSWSIVGYGVNKGIVPTFCDQMFKEMDDKKKGGFEGEFEVTFSMLEIYNEQVRDLLNPASNKKGGLKVRQHPKKGFYAESLSSCAVGSYKEIDSKMEEGTTNRTVAATQMNATSSRAHTVVGITFVQKAKNAAGEEMAKTSLINLVDLAGSERAESTGATGDRLKEGAAINQSLSSLGNVISALADRSSGKKVRVPFRDSVLTKLLKNALGGNSKTTMIAAVSPADINYDETLSTLRYADRAKQIKTTATVNEDPTEKLIRELSEENDRLKKMLESGGVVLEKGSGEDGIEEEEGMSEEEKAALKKELEEDYAAQLEANRQEMEDMKKAFEDKLNEARVSGGDTAATMSSNNEKRKTIPHLYNLNPDPMMSGKVIFFVEKESTTIGNKKGQDVDIVLMGPSIQDVHATITKEGGKYYIEKFNGNCRLLRDGEPLTEKIELEHYDRLTFGTTQLYIFFDPNSKSTEATPTYEQAQEEIASFSGFDMGGNKSRDEMLLQEDLVDIMPAVAEANSISEELDKKKKFELLLVSAEARGEQKGRTQIMVKVIDLETNLEWVWPKEKFINRKFQMQEMFEDFEEGEDVNVPPERDPFSEDPNVDVHIGSIKLWLQSLAYLIEIKEQLEITDYRGEMVGIMNVEVFPCNKKGKEYTEKDDMWVDAVEDLIGKDVHFLVKINSARGLPNRFTDVYAKFMVHNDVGFTSTSVISDTSNPDWKFKKQFSFTPADAKDVYAKFLVYVDSEFTSTKSIKDTSNPDWNFKKQFSFTPATKQLVEYMDKGAIMIQIWGKQKPPKTKKTVNTKATLVKQAMSKGTISAANSNFKTVDAEKVRFAMELAVSRKRAEKAETKVANMRELVKLAEQHQKPRISTKLIKELLAAPTQDAAQKCLKMVPKEKGAEDGGGGEEKSSTCVLL